MAGQIASNIEPAAAVPAAGLVASDRARPLNRVMVVGRRALHYLGSWLGRSLGRRFVTVSLGLLLVIQLTSFVVIDASLRQHALSALPVQLDMGAQAMQGLITWRGEKLIDGARLLAADYGFRSAVLSNDRETIASVLSNHGARIGAAEVALLGVDLSIVALADGSSQGMLYKPTLIKRLAARAAAAGGSSEMAVLQGKPRQLVLVPMKAPLLVGWVLISFPLPESIANDVSMLSAAELTVLSHNSPDEPWLVAFSHLSPQQASQLAARSWAGERNATAPGQGMSEMSLGAREFGVRAIWLTPDSDGPGGKGTTPEVLAVLSVSMEEAARAPRDLQIALLVTTLIGFVTFGLASAYTSRRITTPLKSLAIAAERLGAGDSFTPIRAVGSHDEVRELAHAFEQMRVNLASKQEQIVQSEKMASIGQLSAGVAHEINNPIGFVFSNFGTLEDYLARLFKMLAAYKQAEAALAGTPVAKQLERMRDEIELDYLEEDIPALMSESKDGIKRVRKIVQDLKDFSHVDMRQEWEFASLHAGIDSTLNIVNNEIKYKADVIKQYGELPLVECLPSELNQVFMNLLVNAAHAIGSVRGTITVRSGVDGGDAWVEVADTGSGIAPADLKRIFDPFFTTKPVGKGTGLGLSLSYGIVKKHGGRIDVTSELGRGTAFRVIVPIRRVAPPPDAA